MAESDALKGEEPLSMESDEVRRQEEREMELIRQVMETAGIYGPIEEMDFYRP